MLKHKLNYCHCARSLASPSPRPQYLSYSLAPNNARPLLYFRRDTKPLATALSAPSWRPTCRPLKIKPTANKVYHPVTRSLSTTTNLQSKFEDGFAETAGRITAWAILTGGVSGGVWYGCKRSRSFVLRRSTRAWKSAGQGISGRISKEKERAQSWTRSGKARFDETVGKSCREGTRVVTKLCEATGKAEKRLQKHLG